MIEVTHDDFLGGQLRLAQPVRGYRAGVDPVLLAASVAAKAGQSVLDVGCGVGTAALCLGRRVGGVTLSGVEVVPEYAELARQNAQDNGLAMLVHAGSLKGNPFAETQFDHVIMNPPFFQKGTASDDAGKQSGRLENLPLFDWISYAKRRLRTKGQLTIIQSAGRLDDILVSLVDGFGDIKIRPIAPRQGRVAKLVLVRATKSSRTPLTILPPLSLHSGLSHDDEKDYAPEIEAVLRNGAALQIFD